MIEFDMNNILSELEGMTVKEKLQALDDLYNELEEVMQEVLSTEDEIKEEYSQKHKQALTAAVQSYLNENGMTDSVELKDDVITLIHNNHPITIIPLCCDAEWSLSIRTDDHLKDSERTEVLSEIAKLTGSKYKSGDYEIEILVSEEELRDKVIEVIKQINK